MSRGMRLMVMMLILIGVITGMMQCAKKSMTQKHPAAAAPTQEP